MTVSDAINEYQAALQALEQAQEACDEHQRKGAHLGYELVRARNRVAVLREAMDAVLLGRPLPPT